MLCGRERNRCTVRASEAVVYTLIGLIASHKKMISPPKLIWEYDTIYRLPFIDDSTLSPDKQD